MVYYCKNCREKVEPKRKKLDSFQLQILIIASLASFGLALPAFLIYRLIVHKKKYCPNCGENVEFYESPDDIPKKIPVINLPISSKKEEKEKADEKEYSKCIECGEMIESDVEVCPFCGVIQNEKENPE